MATIVVQSKTNNVFIGIRVLEPGEDKIKAAMERYKIYPYASAPIRLQHRVGDVRDGKAVDPSAAARHESIWESLDEMLQQEPVEERDRMITAMLAPLGLEKGKKLQPNERQTKLLTEGAHHRRADGDEHLLCQAVREFLLPRRTPNGPT